MTTKQSKGHRPARGETPSQAQVEVRDITVTLAELEELTIAGLHGKWADVFGEACRSRNRQHLIKKLAWKLQADAEGGLSEAALAKINELDETTSTRQRLPRKAKATPAPVGAGVGEPTDENVASAPATKERDARLPPVGTVLRPKYKGREFAITMLDDTFEVEGVGTFKSLSAAAKGATGQVMNGFLWCGLIPKAVPIAQTEKGGDA